MLKKANGRISEKVKTYATITGAVISICAISFVSYRLGAQHGVNVTCRVIHKYDPQLFEQVDKLFEKIGVN